ALALGNNIIPAGNIYVKDSMPVVNNNATVVDVKQLRNIPLKLGENVYLRDVAQIQDNTDITYGYALVNGQKSVYLPIIKKDTGSTLTVVADVNRSMDLFSKAVNSTMRERRRQRLGVQAGSAGAAAAGGGAAADDIKVKFEFDESPTVVAAVESVATEGL